jgi:hypothetical protein
MPRQADNGTNGAGPLHLLKMAVGVADIDELRRFRAARLKERGASWVYTRNHPRRTEEVLAGGDPRPDPGPATGDRLSRRA